MFNLSVPLRTVSPVFFGTIFSASLSDTTRNIGYPLDYHLIFLLISGVFLLVNVLVGILPESINRQKIAK